MNKAQRILEKLYTDTQVKLISTQFIKLINTGKLLGNMTNANVYTDDSKLDDYMNNKETGWYPVAITPNDISSYIVVGSGRVFTSPSLYDNAYRDDNIDTDALKKESETKLVKNTMYFAKDDIVGYYNKRGYFIVDKSNPTIIRAKIGVSYYDFKTTDNKDLFDAYK